MKQRKYESDENSNNFSRDLEKNMPKEELNNVQYARIDVECVVG
jgi:hypothetical protein